jgi:H+/Cl- antiporter ClcA
MGLRPEKVKALIPVGAAAAIAAAFNTPMAAVLFSLEEVMGDMNAPPGRAIRIVRRCVCRGVMLPICNRPRTRTSSCVVSTIGAET